jgi:hypothetical protein
MIRWTMSLLAATLPALAAAPVAAQAGDSVRADTAVPAPPPPVTALTPEQERYMEGLQTAGRGIAQLKSGLGQVTRARSARDTVAQRRAAQTLAGLCGTARDFMRRGRTQMQASAFEDSTRLKARRLAVEVDSLVAFMPACSSRARREAEQVGTDLLTKLRRYETVLRDFRTAIGLPNR